jgi:hypothetical protein
MEGTKFKEEPLSISGKRKRKATEKGKAPLFPEGSIKKNLV